jgi:hypothetical protein
VLIRERGGRERGRGERESVCLVARVFPLFLNP